VQNVIDSLASSELLDPEGDNILILWQPQSFCIFAVVLLKNSCLDTATVSQPRSSYMLGETAARILWELCPYICKSSREQLPGYRESLTSTRFLGLVVISCLHTVTATVFLGLLENSCLDTATAWQPLYCICRTSGLQLLGNTDSLTVSVFLGLVKNSWLDTLTAWKPLYN